ncbi:hypothetical protein HDU76_012407 [Blyttiomyces sp. JEL0837]|nr:hypothetical protein HDU76_012407 [Blyttiomyces sp. JEL0837]
MTTESGPRRRTPSKLSSRPTSSSSLEDVIGKPDVNQIILDAVSSIYTISASSDHVGLCELATRYGVEVVAPKRKIWILLTGNHSSGKSSQINWYIEETVQKTSVAIETTGFTLITSGKRRETFNGPATCQLFPFLKDLGNMKGVMAALSTEVVPSRAKTFSSITFIDSPGLVDGQMNYPFDPEAALARLAQEVDLILVFFDPIGQALCERTMRVVERISGTEGHKMHFFLSKADTVPDETDRQRVLVQIAQNLTYRIKDRQFSLNIPPIYIPTEEPVPVRNHIHELLQTIEKTIAMGVQKSLESLERDCLKISKAIAKKIEVDERQKLFNRRSSIVGVGLTLPLIMATIIIVHRWKWLPPNDYSLRINAGFRPSTSHDRLCNGNFSAFFRAVAFLHFLFGKRKTLTRKQKAGILEDLNLVSKVLPERHKELYTEYFEAHLASNAHVG